MKTKLIKYTTLILLFCLHTPLWAQKDNNLPEPDEKIEAAKVAYITTRVNLIPEQGKAFWPVYTAFATKRKAYIAEIKVLRKSLNSLTTTDAQVKDGLFKVISLKTEEIALEKEYLDKFMKILNPRQINELMRAERDFNHLIISRLRESKDGKDNNLSDNPKRRWREE